jgi:hypothetical protein
MNASTNLSWAITNSSTLSSNVALRAFVFYIIFDIIYVYVIPAVCVIGFFLNLIALLTLLSPNLKGNMYKFLVSKTIFSMIILIIGSMLPYTYCRNCVVFQSLGQTIFRTYFTGYITLVCYLGLSVNEILLTYDRFVILSNKAIQKWEKKFKYCIIVTVFLALFAFSPTIFSSEIIQVGNSTTRYVDRNTPFGNSVFYPIYLSTIAFVQNFLTCLILCILDALIVRQYKKYIAKKSNLTSISKNTDTKKSVSSVLKQNLEEIVNSNETIVRKVRNSQLDKRNDEKSRFTRMILVLSLILCYSRFLLLVSQILSQMNEAFKLSIDIVALIFLTFARFNAYFIFSTNLFVYIYYNRVFRQELVRICSKAYST